MVLAHSAFQQLEELICKAPDFQEEFCMETDVCKQGVGAFLQQKVYQ